MLKCQYSELGCTFRAHEEEYLKEHYWSPKYSIYHLNLALVMAEDPSLEVLDEQIKSMEKRIETMKKDLNDMHNGFDIRGNLIQRIDEDIEEEVYAELCRYQRMETAFQYSMKDGQFHNSKTPIWSLKGLFTF